MSIKQEQCLTVCCDSCGDGWNDYDFRPHFVDQAAALAAAAEAGWRVQDGGRWFCRPCADRADCARHGHVWPDWLDCRCGGSIVLHQAVGCLRFRFCDRCGLGDSEPLVAPT
jgi:hypothetical protein